MPEPGDGEVLVRRPSGSASTPPSAPGCRRPRATSRRSRSARSCAAAASAAVVASRSDTVRRGRPRRPPSPGWQEYAVVGDDRCSPTRCAEGVDPQASLARLRRRRAHRLRRAHRRRRGRRRARRSSCRRPPAPPGRIAVQIAKILGLPGDRHRRHRREVRAGSSTTSASTAPSTTAPTTSRPGSRSCARSASTCSSTTSAARSSTPCSAASPTAPGSCCAAPSPPTTTTTAAGPGELPQPHPPPGPDGGLPLLGLTGAGSPRSPAILGGVGRRRASCSYRTARLRGPRVGRRRPQRHVHRREHRQDRHPAVSWHPTVRRRAPGPGHAGRRLARPGRPRAPATTTARGEAIRVGARRHHHHVADPGSRRPRLHRAGSVPGRRHDPRARGRCAGRGLVPGGRGHHGPGHLRRARPRPDVGRGAAHRRRAGRVHDRRRPRRRGRPTASSPSCCSATGSPASGSSRRS